MKYEKYPRVPKTVCLRYIQNRNYYTQVQQGKAKSFNCKPEYKGKSVVPSKITITSGKDGVDVFKQTIEVW